MQLTKATEMLLLLSAFAGAIHVLSPDHWMPASILAWQRGWKLSKVSSFAAGVLLVHVALGFVVFFVLNQVFNVWLEPIHLPFESMNSASSTRLTVPAARTSSIRRLCVLFVTGKVRTLTI